MKINEKWHKHIFAGIAGFIALIVYMMTMAPTVSFWDCGEFVACANTLGIPHPPGTPFFVFFARAVILLLPFVGEIAKRVNYISVVSSAATVYVTALFAWELLATVLKTDSLAEKISEKMRTFVLGTAALVAGFLLTFSDTFWFNAVEAEVYGVAMFILMLVSYLGLVWYNKREESGSDRILIFICYIAFLGVGAHLYTMLTVPAVFALLLVAQPKKIVERIPIWITGTLLCSVIYMVSAFIEISLFCLVVLSLVVFVPAIRSVFPARVNHAFKLSLAFAFFALVGYSTHLYIPIRSELNPTIDENDPELNIRDEQGNLQLGNLFEAKNWEAFNAFIERKQYGSESMITRAFYRRSQIAHQVLSFPSMSYGGYQMAQYLPTKVGGVNYANGVYAFDASENEPIERLGFKFPTQMSFMGDNTFMQLFFFLLFNGLLVATCVYVYKRNKHVGIFISSLYALCSLGLLFYINFADGTRMEQRDRDYWVSAMTRNVADLNNAGAGITSLPDPNELIDLRQEIETAKYRIERLRMRNAPASQIVEFERKISAAENTTAWKNWQKIEESFARFGQRAPFPEAVHMEVRERDYFYTPAFIFMSMIYGIGAGILVLLAATTTTTAAFASPIAAALVLVSLLVPCISNYKEHDRSGLWVPWDYAYNLLNSCRPNAILFTNGDNDTFPLWFAQEVAGVRKDVRVVNLSLGNTDWYIKQMLTNEPVLKLSYNKETIDNDMVLDNSSANNPNHQVATWVRRAEALKPKLKERIDQMEAKGYLSDADSAKLLQFKVNYQVWDAFLDWAKKYRSSMMLTQYKLVIDLALQNMDRPIEISTTVGNSNFMGLEKYMVQEGMVYNFVKGDLTPKQNAFDAKVTAAMIDTVYKFRGLGDGSAYINSETERLLSSYVSLYLQISFDAREKIAALVTKKPFTSADKAEVERIATDAAKYLELGIYQFPREWRNYWAASYVYASAGMKDKAVDVIERGLKNIPAYDGPGQNRLAMSLKQIEAITEDLLKVDEAPADAPAADAAPSVN
ncbi:putative membrane protein [Fibrobacter succinogenes subsp. succinogenes S85]|uniref:Putative membrane protein n=2 Tax=Pseudomonadati TaxID=3379134 RepID=C9RN70_FIBSS|nr:DUF2723 domain-containing protein [Fibrobacter succinogenes]ACX76322.1 hypothetical protein Fisuc_2739 [Fibrobacter succinogenes subsp. succinogenes S85]ADL25438.1 putative membrane protein [Fibrobacter succinogenes subsp. succinogenes S85]